MIKPAGDTPYSALALAQVSRGSLGKGDYLPQVVQQLSNLKARLLIQCFIGPGKWGWRM